VISSEADMKTPITPSFILWLGDVIDYVLFVVGIVLVVVIMISR
jgi:hypothetical protein